MQIFGGGGDVPRLQSELVVDLDQFDQYGAAQAAVRRNRQKAFDERPLVVVAPSSADRRVRTARLTRAGLAERADHPGTPLPCAEAVTADLPGLPPLESFQRGFDFYSWLTFRVGQDGRISHLCWASPAADRGESELWRS